MADKVGLLPLAHKTISHTLRGYKVQRKMIQVLADFALFQSFLQAILQFQGKLVRFICLLREFSTGKTAGNIVQIACKVTGHVYHEALSRQYRAAVGSDGVGGMSGSSQSKIVGRTGRGIIAGQHTAHKNIHVGTVCSEQTQITVQTHNALEFYGQFCICHARPEKPGNAAVGGYVQFSRFAYQRLLVGRFYAAGFAQGLAAVYKPAVGKTPL